MKNYFSVSSFGILLVAFALPCKAALIVRDGGMVYDDVYNRTWLQDANYANTHGFDFSGGAMDWGTASNWVSTLNIGGFTEWRLPTQNDFKPWFETQLCDYSVWGNPQLHAGPFTNIQLAGPITGSYWTSDRTVVNNDPSYAYIYWLFYNAMWAYPTDPNDGYWFYVWPVRTGDVVTPVASPTLQIFRTTTNAVVLSWPGSFSGFILQSTTNLASIWTTNLPAPVIVNGQYTVTNPISGTRQFFRLSH